MKKIIAILLAITLVVCLSGCDQGSTKGTDYLVGMVCIGDESAAYDANFYKACDAVTAKLADEGIKIEWMYTKNHAEGQAVVEDNELLASEGCCVVFNNSYGQESAMLQVAGNFPNTVFVGLTNEVSSRDDLPNTLNAFPNIYEARYLAGIVVGAKLNELIQNGIITKDEANLGYVGAYTYSEVISGLTAFYLGAKSVCPSAKMYVNFIGSWGDYGLEKEAATTLIEDYHCVVISQHSDQVSPAVVAQEKGVFHVGYNIDMTGEDMAPNASLVSSRIDWTNYFYTVIKAAIGGFAQDQDYIGHGLAAGDVELTPLNEAICAEGTDELVEIAKCGIIEGTIHVFDTSTFTVDGKELTEFLVDMDGDYQGDAGYNAVFDGYFHESYFKSAPSFSLCIDGITFTNVVY